MMASKERKRRGPEEVMPGGPPDRDVYHLVIGDKGSAEAAHWDRFKAACACRGLFVRRRLLQLIEGEAAQLDRLAKKKED